MIHSILAKLPRRHKNRLKAVYSTWKARWISTFRSFGPAELAASLAKLGLGHGDSVLVHSEFSPYNGFTGSVGQVTDVFLDTVGPDGNLLMVSLPYLTSSREYLRGLMCFDVRKTPSKMGIASEFFRRRKGVLRSLHPTHPVLALGPKAEWIVANHEDCIYPCGPGSPFEKLLELGGKVVFFDVEFDAFTYIHYLEHRVRDQLHFPVYDDEQFEVPVIDRDGNGRLVKTLVFSQQAIRRRRVSDFERRLRRAGVILRERMGNATILAVELERVNAHVDEMSRDGVCFYDMSP